jgi:hypothetical protein
MNDMEPDYNFEADLQDITNSMLLVIDELQNGQRREPDYIEGFVRTITNQLVQLLNARGFERNHIIDIFNDEASA